MRQQLLSADDSDPDRQTWRVEEIASGRLFALKCLQPHAIENRDLSDEFVRAFDVSSELQSRHICKIVDYGVDAELGPWIVSDYYPRVNLSAYLSDHRDSSLTRRRQIIMQILNGACDIHQRKWVHRNLKPGNIFVNQSISQNPQAPDVFISDFGLSRRVNELQSGALGRYGDLHWLAPEQYKSGVLIDPRVDVWALGLLAYYVLSGKRYAIPVKSAVYQDARSGVLSTQTTLPAASALLRSQGVPLTLPSGFDEWFSKCVSIDPDRRFANADELREAFVNHLLWPPPSSGTSSRQVAAASTMRPALSLAPPGRFTMGSGRSVRLSQSVAVAVTPITRSQYYQVSGLQPGEHKFSSDAPVTAVCWRDALIYCNKLSFYENLEPVYDLSKPVPLWRTDLKNPGYRLLTDAEWEYVALAGDSKSPAAITPATCWCSENAENRVHSVGQKASNAWGIFDMLGNVWEWVWDHYVKTFPMNEAVDPVTPASTSSLKNRVIRGGCYSDSVSELSYSLRQERIETNQSRRIGFRVCRTIRQ